MTVMPFMIYSLSFGAVTTLGVACVPLIMQRTQGYVRRRVEDAHVRLDDMFVEMPQRKLQLLHVGAPLGLGLAGWLVTGLWPVGLMGLGIGMVIPKFMIQQMGRLRRDKFQAQFIDCLLMLSSSLRAGLSMQQSFGVVAEELVPPINQEFGLIVKQTRMGVPLEQSMERLKQRMPSDDTTLFSTSVLVARQTGGDVTGIFTRLVATLRERRKVRERIKTLTYMARMQGVVMAALPLLFSGAIYSMDPNHFNFFLTDPTGRLLLAGVILLQLVGTALFVRFGRSPI